MAAKTDYTLDDFRKKFDQLAKMDDDLLVHMPGLPPEDGRDAKDSLRRIRRMIDAMTEEERRNPDDIDLSHRQRMPRRAVPSRKKWSSSSRSSKKCES